MKSYFEIPSKQFTFRIFVREACISSKNERVATKVLDRRGKQYHAQPVLGVQWPEELAGMKRIRVCFHQNSLMTRFFSHGNYDLSCFFLIAIFWNLYLLELLRLWSALGSLLIISFSPCLLDAPVSCEYFFAIFWTIQLNTVWIPILCSDFFDKHFGVFGVNFSKTPKICWNTLGTFNMAVNPWSMINYGMQVTEHVMIMERIPCSMYQCHDLFARWQTHHGFDRWVLA